MSVFSELLKSYTDRCGIPIVTLAKQCGIDRTTLHKIISGERRPPAEDFIVKISRELMLSAVERDRLAEQYEISLIGDELYARRRNVTLMLNQLAEIAGRERSHNDVFYRVDNTAENGITMYSDKNTMLRAFYAVLTTALENGSNISIIAQPSEDFLRFMRFTSSYYKGSEIRHIFCLDNTLAAGDANNYNLGVFPMICEMSFTYSDYRPMYYYDRVESHINSASLLPVLMYGDGFVFRASNDLTSGMIIRDDDQVTFYRREFEKLESSCYPFVERAKGIVGMLGSGKTFRDYSFTLDTQPSFMLVCSIDEAMNTMILPDEQASVLADRMRLIQERYIGREYMSIFSAMGLRRFMKTGVIKELPESFYRNVPPANRLRVLRTMIESCEQEKYDFRIIEDEGFNRSEHLRINIDSEGAVHFVLRSSTSYVFITVAEQSVKLAMHDYITSLIESGRILSRERSIEVMRSVYEEARVDLADTPPTMTDID